MHLLVALSLEKIEIENNHDVIQKKIANFENIDFRGVDLMITI
jgi:hypothetical protein